MLVEFWPSLMPEVGGVFWCTHATQAWRQAQAAVWAQSGETVSGPNFRLSPRFDKLRSERGRGRVVARVCKETTDLFNSVFPVSLSEALQAGDDMEAWGNSGADKLVEFLVETLLSRSQSSGGVGKVGSTTSQPHSPAEEIVQAEVFAIEDRREAADHDIETQAEAAPSAGGAYIVPRRVKAERRGRRPAERLAGLEAIDE